MKQLAILVLSAFCLSSLPSYAKNSTDFQLVLKSVPAAELPAKSAELVKKAKARDWGTTTVGVVKTAVKMSPPSAPAVVGAIAKSVPEMASIAASTAAEAQPKQAAAIAKAAAAAAPSKAGKIVTAVVRMVPTQTRSVAVAVAEAVPGSEREVLAGVASAQPELRRTLAAHTPTTASSVGTAIDKASADVIVAGPQTRGPSIGAPYLPPSQTPGNINSGTSIPVPPGGRDYSEP